MLKLNNKTLLIKYTFLIAIICLAFFITVPAGHATSISGTGLNTTAQAGYDNNIPFANTSPATIIGKIVGALLAFIGVLFFVLMIYGGFLWMTARGNDQQVEKAKDLIIAAIIGMVIIFAAYAITMYLGQIFGQSSGITSQGQIDGYDSGD